MHVYGSDTHRRGRAVREICDKYRNKYPDGTVATFDLGEGQEVFDALRKFAGAPGLFAKASLAVVLSPADGEKPFVKFLKEISEAAHVTVLVVADKKLPKDFALLYEKGVGPAKAEFEPLEGLEFLKFLKADAVEKGLRVTDTQLKSAGELFAGDTWGAVTEVERMAFGGELGEKKTQLNFQAAMGSLANAGAPAQRLRMLFLLLESDDPGKIFNMAAAWSRGEGKVKFADYDIAVKSGQLEFGEALLEYVLTTP